MTAENDQNGTGTLSISAAAKEVFRENSEKGTPLFAELNYFADSLHSQLAGLGFRSEGCSKSHPIAQLKCSPTDQKITLLLSIHKQNTKFSVTEKDDEKHIESRDVISDILLLTLSKGAEPIKIESGEARHSYKRPGFISWEKHLPPAQFKWPERNEAIKSVAEWIMNNCSLNTTSRLIPQKPEAMSLKDAAATLG